MEDTGKKIEFRCPEKFWPTLRALAVKFNAALDSSWFKAGGILLLLAVYFVAYLKDPALPGASGASGWWRFGDQSKYLDSARTLAEGTLDPGTYWYPLGYPALGAIFYRILPLHPFLPINVISVLATAVFFGKICRAFLSPVHVALIFVLTLVLLSTELRISLIEPWNTIPTMAMAYGLIWAQFKPKNTRRGVLFQFALVGVTYLIRPMEGIFLLGIPVLASFRGRGWRRGVLTMLTGGAVFAVFPVAVALINLKAFGSIKTPYEQGSAAVGFFSYPILLKLYSLFVDGLPLFGLADTALLLRMPWLILVPVGLASAVRTQRSGVLAILAGGALCFAAYVAYNDFSPLNIYRFGLIHYLCWTLPLFFLFAYLAVVKLAVFRPAALAWLLVSVVLLTLVRVERVAFPASTDAQGRVTAGSVDEQDVDAAAFGVILPWSPVVPAILERKTALHPFHDFLWCEDIGGEQIVFASRKQPDELQFLPERLHGRSVIFTRVHWGTRGAADLPEAALRLFGRRGPLVPTVKAVAAPLPNGESRVEVTVRGAAYLLRGAPAWAVQLLRVGGVEVFSSVALPLPFQSGPLHVEPLTGSLRGQVILSFTARGPLPKDPVLAISPMSASGEPFFMWKCNWPRL